MMQRVLAAVGLVLLLSCLASTAPASGKTIRVAKDGGSYSTVQSAVYAALPGDEVYVAVGVYQEAIVLKAGVSLRGEGSDKVTVTFAGDSPVVTARDIQSGQVEGMTLSYTGSGGNCAVWLVGSNVTIAGCVVTSSDLACIEVTEGAAPVLEGNVIRGGKPSGVQIRGSETKGTVRNNQIYGNAYSGIAVSDGAAPVIEGNVIRDGKLMGVYIWGSGTKGTVRNNQIYGNASTGVVVSEGAGPVIDGNTIVRNEGDGIWANDAAAPAVTNNIIALNDGDGVSTIAPAPDRKSGSPVLSYNDVWGNSAYAYRGVSKPATDISADPLFVNAERGDFHLRPDSPCLGAGAGGVSIGAASLATLPSVAALPSPTVTPPASATPPAGVVRFGSYDLRKVALLKCASANDRPYVAILLSEDGESWIMLDDVLLDSGADRSLFPASAAEALGIDLSQCPEGTSSGVGGTTTTYSAEVRIAIIHMGGVEPDVDGYILATGGGPLVITSIVAFSRDEANADKYLLGRRDVFDALTLTFEGNTATITPRSP